jgi:hypothetical protein
MVPAGDRGLAFGSPGITPLVVGLNGYTVANAIAPVVAIIIAYINTGNPITCRFTISIIIYVL